MTQNLLLSATHKIPKPNHARQNSTNWNITHRESLQCNHWNLTHRRSSLNLMVAAPFAIPMGGTPSGTGSSLQKKTSCLQNFKQRRLYAIYLLTWNCPSVGEGKKGCLVKIMVTWYTSNSNNTIRFPLKMHQTNVKLLSIQTYQNRLRGWNIDQLEALWFGTTFFLTSVPFCLHFFLEDNRWQLWCDWVNQNIIFFWVAGEGERKILSQTGIRCSKTFKKKADCNACICLFFFCTTKISFNFGPLAEFPAIFHWKWCGFIIWDKRAKNHTLNARMNFDPELWPTAARRLHYTFIVKMNLTLKHAHLSSWHHEKERPWF